MICRFPNEGGILGPPALPTVRACLPAGHATPDSFAWQLHDNSVAFWGGDQPYPDRMLERWLGLAARQLGPTDHVYWAGVVQGAGLAEYVKNFRRRMFNSAAAVYPPYGDSSNWRRRAVFANSGATRLRAAIDSVNPPPSAEGQVVNHRHPAIDVRDGPLVTSLVRPCQFVSVDGDN